MTREEAIKILQGAIKNPNTKDGYLGQSIDMAIKALEQESCEDCISRLATVKRLCNVADFMNKKREGLGSPYVMAALFIQDNKDEFPSVTPQPKTGHWITVDKGWKVTSYKCSECGRIVINDTGYDVTKDYPYCHCGAKMIVPQESDEV